MTDNNEKIKWISGLKGVCAVTVVMLHLLACFFPEVLIANTRLTSGTYNFISLTPINILFNGSFSVYIFWTISGFLIANSWYQKHSTEDMARKVLNKYFRLFLPITVCSIGAFILIKAGFYYNVDAGGIIGGGYFINERDFSLVTLKTMLADVLWNNFFTSKVTLLPPLWTMKIEFWGSCLTIFLLLLFGERKYRYVIWGIAIAVMIRISANTYICFLSGIMLADYYRKKEKCVRGGYWFFAWEL